MREKTCCFTGHRDISKEEYQAVKNKTTREIVRLIDRGVTDFIVGGARGFDTLAAEAVLELKKANKHIRLVLMIPCETQTKGWRTEDVVRYHAVKCAADCVEVLSPEYYQGCMHVRNRRMVDCSAYCICFLRRESGGTAYTVRYARRKGAVLIEV